MSLMCGGRGPCCHVGYSHRHCEHCDTVIPISVPPHQHYGYPWAWSYGTLTQQVNPFAGQQQLNSNLFQQLQSSLGPATEVHIDAGQQSSST